ncbi:MAG: apolipoprotein N-acyltransferase [Planctomycetia bacterium]|nr:apolipoprotein N-acyltransferase [Planctomycetia bacterium]
MTRPAAQSARLPSDSTSRRPKAWWCSTWALGLSGSALLWAALPPLDFGPLAWLAAVPWVMLIRQGGLSGKRPYGALWLAGFAFWLSALYWLTLPHWATAFGWLAVSCVLAFFLPGLVGLSRVAVHTLRISPLVAAPVVWTGLELLRAHILGGFAMAFVAHTQYRWTNLIQISDTLGSYGVSFLIIFVAACIARMLPCEDSRRAWWPALPAAAALGAVLAYGHWRTNEQTTEPGPKVALIQGSIDIEMKYDPKQGQRIFDEYFGLSRQAVTEHPDLDLIVWPETMFRYPWYTFDEKYQPPPDVHWTTSEAEASSREQIENTVAPLHTPFLLGIDTVHQTPNGFERYNSALFTDRGGKVQGRYDKCQLVAFGEYVPLAETFPWLCRLTPLPFGLSSGSGPQSVQIGSTRFSANICYEDTLPHLIRAQVRQLRAENREPEILVNLTNDGWYWGSSELDMHLACAVFRAIECRKPLLIAANTGLSAWIDSNGRIRAQGRRRATDVIVATTTIDHRGSWYLDYGDTPAAVCLIAVGGLAIVGVRERRAARKKAAVVSS